ncbi:hypothetical protein AB9P05_23770 [Roseivirga sp. BDSF3-8]|uniref:hypothetical protein n=1 Tax=Roseivirga sp. BDSF3-8 TaxID=3241598 RepID=UPI00353246D3
MKTSRKLLYGKTILLSVLATVAITVITVYFTGIESHRSLLANSYISFGVLATCFFLFLLVSLYNGLNVKDDYSHKLHLTWRKSKKFLPDVGGGSDFLPDMGGGDNPIGAFLFWIVATIVVVFVLIFILPFIWSGIVFIFLAIYWVIIRSLRLIFKKSPECEGNALKSIGYSLLYTMLYIGWIFGVIYLASLF